MIKSPPFKNEVDLVLAEFKKLLVGATTPWLSLNEACEYCKCSKSTINRMYNLDLISRYRVLPFTDKTKGNWLYSKSELDEVIGSNRTSTSLARSRHISRYGRK